MEIIFNYLYKSMKKILFIIANFGFQDEEFSIPFDILTAQGHQCEVASWMWGKCRGVFFKTIEKSLSLDEVQIFDYDLLVFVGGGGAYEEYFQHAKYLQLAREAKAVAAICIAPTLLSDAGIYQGKQVTGRDDGFWTQIHYLEKNGALFRDEEVVQDWNLITANGPAAATKFAWAIVEYLDNLNRNLILQEKITNDKL